MKGKIKRFIIAAMAITALCGNVFTVSAAESTDAFDPDYYASTYADLATVYGNDANALYQHYITCGIAEGRMGSATFDVRKYRAAYPDLEAAFGDNWGAYLDHYVNAGAAEGRTAGLINGTQATPAPNTTPAQTTPVQTTPVQTQNTSAANLAMQNTLERGRAVRAEAETPLPTATEHNPAAQIIPLGIDYSYRLPQDGMSGMHYLIPSIPEAAYNVDDVAFNPEGPIYEAHLDANHGYPVRGRWYSADGTLLFYNLYFYDANKVCVKEEMHMADGSLVYYTVLDSYHTNLNDGHIAQFLTLNNATTYYMPAYPRTDGVVRIVTRQETWVDEDGVVWVGKNYWYDAAGNYVSGRLFYNYRVR